MKKNVSIPLCLLPLPLEHIKAYYSSYKHLQSNCTPLQLRFCNDVNTNTVKQFFRYIIFRNLQTKQHQIHKQFISCLFVWFFTWQDIIGPAVG